MSKKTINNFLIFLKRIYKEEYRFFKQNYLAIFLGIALVFFVIFVFSYFIFLMFPELSKSVLVSFIDAQPWIKDAANMTSSQLFGFILGNNIRASGIAILFGLVPFLFLPIIFAITNATLLGLVMATSTIAGMDPISIFIRMILPHAIFELPAFFYAVVIGIFFNFQLLKIVSGSRKNVYRLREVFWYMLRSFLVVVVPFLIVAAFIESFITVLFAG